MVQQDGIGFPLARLAVLLSLATGACHDLAIPPYAGKGTEKTTLLRQMYDSLSPGDVVLADALFDNYFRPATCTPHHDCGGHDKGHKHGPNCGHAAVPHGDHVDYVVDGHLHHPHGDHCDNHGPVRRV